jgi:hypothetical protein
MHSALAAALLSAALIPAQAQTAGRSAQTVVVAAPAVPLPAAATLRAMTGDYALSDGRRLRVLNPGLNLMAAVGSRWAVPLEPLGEHRFASRDGRLTVEFLPGADGSFDDLRMVENQIVTLAARRALP